jgi:hypothetical protein
VDVGGVPRGVLFIPGVQRGRNRSEITPTSGSIDAVDGAAFLMAHHRVQAGTTTKRYDRRHESILTIVESGPGATTSTRQAAEQRRCM